jgi:hypothetical protein
VSQIIFQHVPRRDLISIEEIVGHHALLAFGLKLIDLEASAACFDA